MFEPIGRSESLLSKCLKEAEAVFKGYLNNAQHWNRYPYALNNPLKYVDPTGGAEKVVVNLNIIYDKEYYASPGDAEKAVAKQVEDLKKVYAPLDIEFKITYTPGSANNLTDANKARVAEGVVEGALNVFVSRKGGMDTQFSHTSTGLSYLNMANIESGQYAFTAGALAHEVAHQFGVGRPGALSNLIADAQLGWANWMLRRGFVQEGRDWVDDYRNVTYTEYWRNRGEILGHREVQRNPTTYDVYRVGARRFPGKR